MNRPDAQQRAGRYAPPPGASDLPGLEAAGEVAAVGPGGSSPWKVGDAVCALLPGGGYAEYALTHQDHALPVPDGMEMVAAAGLCETFFTVWGNVFERGRLAAGEVLLVHGGSSGIGTTAIQLAAARGARVFATAGSEAKCRACLDLGAELAIDYRTDDFVQAVRAATDGRGADVVLDMVGGDYLARDVKALAPEGRLVMIAHQTGGGGRARLRAGDGEAADDHRLDAAAAVGRGEGADRRGAAARGLAAARRRADRAGDRPGLSARGGGRGARAAGELGACGQDHPGGRLSAVEPTGLAVRGRGAAEHLVEPAAGAVGQRAGQGVEGVEAGRDDLERGGPRRALAGAAGDEEHDVVAAVADRVPVDVEELGRPGEHEVALLARLALGRLAAALAEVDRAAGQV